MSYSSTSFTYSYSLASTQENTDYHFEFTEKKSKLKTTSSFTSHLYGVNVAQQEDDARQCEEKENRGIFGQISAHGDPLYLP